MPIIVKEFDFEETEELLVITLSLYNTPPKDVDIYINSCYVKVNYIPFFFELDLAQDLDHLNSYASIGDGIIKLSLLKIQKVYWPNLKYTEIDRLERRLDAEVRAVETHSNLKRIQLVQRREQERALIREQMQVEQAKRSVVEQRKQAETDSASQSILQYANIGDPAQELSEDEESDSDIDIGLIRAKIESKLEPMNHVSPRSCVTVVIPVTFTSRGIIPTTTARESEDAKWMARIKLTKTLNSSHPILEQQKQEMIQLREKGNKFFKLGNYEGALNAYNEANKVDSLDLE